MRIPTQGLSSEELSRVTFRWDRIRGGAQGLAETSWQVFALLIAIRYFEADESLKQLIPVGMGLGLMLSPFSLALISRSNYRISSIIAFAWIGVATALAGMIFSPSILPYVLCVVATQICVSQSIPLLTQVYSQNYPTNIRGARLSATFVISSILGMTAGYFGGRILDNDISNYQWVIGGAIAAAILYSISSYKIPSQPACNLKSRNPIRSLALAWKDPLFMAILAGWMLMGLGNLMLIPIRVEYLANPAYGINATNAQITFILVSVVLAARLLSTRIWGFFFDRIDIITLRLVLNSIFMASICCFFFTDKLWLITIGAALLGVAFGGGGIMWALYVTKIAPPESVAAYMSVHSFTTGLRMVLAPLLGYGVMQISHPSMSAWIALLLIGMSSLSFLPQYRAILQRQKELGHS